MGKKEFITYSLLKTIFEKKKDYIDTFCAFVLKIIRSNNTDDIKVIQKLTFNDYKILIPENTIKTILIRAQKRKYIDNNNQLTDEGLKYIANVETIKEVDRRVNELIDDIHNYLGDKSLNLDQVIEVLLIFINKNISSIIDFCSPMESSPSELSVKKRTMYDIKLIEYFNLCNKRKPQIWQTLLDILYGSIISIAACAIDINNVKKKFRNVQVFIDTNFIFSLFGLHGPEFNRPAIELLILLKKFNFDLKVFDFTVDEIKNVLNNSITQRKKYIKGVRVNSIYSVINEKGWSEIDIINKIRSIPEDLKNLEIEIKNTDVNIKKFVPKEEYFEILKKFKDMTSNYKINHDVAAIEEIKKIRRGLKSKIEESKAFFLTSDIKLSEANYLKMSHKENHTITEVVPDRFLTNILWLKDPESFKDLPLNAVISANSKELFIDKRVWERFYENLKNLKISKKIDDSDISLLFYDDYFKNKLLNFNEFDKELSDEVFILEGIEEAKKRLSEDTKRKIEQERKKYELEISEKDLKIQEQNRKEENIKTILDKDSNRNATILTNLIFISIIVAMSLLVSFSIFFLIRNIFLIPIIGLVVGLIGLIFGILNFLGIKLNIFKLKRNIGKKIQEKLYSKNLKKLDLL